MSVVADSPAHSSSSDDFNALLTELDAISDASDDPEEVLELEDDSHGRLNAVADRIYDASADLEHVREVGDGTDVGDDNDARVKKRKVELFEGATSQEVPAQSLALPDGKVKCTHPGVYAGMCMICGQKMDDASSGVAFGYIHKNLRLSSDEIGRLRHKDFKSLLRQKKLYLILDLDHTLLNSTRLWDLTVEEAYLNGQGDAVPDIIKSSLYRVERMQMMTKLRPFIQTFLKEANKLFEMYIYTMGERSYALEMANLLDPGGIYFHSKVIAQGDCTERHQKGLDVVLGQESAVLILDDTEAVWRKHKDNLILMERYHFFASSCKQFEAGINRKSCSELKTDEIETESALPIVLRVLQRIHALFFDSERKDDPLDRDVRQVLKTVRKEVLKDCRLVFSRVFPTSFLAENHHLWRTAELLGATCSIELDPSVTHVVSMDAGTDKSHWATRKNKFLVSPKWIEDSNYRWRREPEEKYPVQQAKKT